MQDFEWGVQGHTFQHTVNVLSLGCYDMILGKDWLDKFSPMWVHWKRQILRFNYQGHRITLHGIQSKKPQCKRVSAHKLRGMMRRGALTHVVQITGSKCDTILSLEDSPEGEPQAALVPPLIAELLTEFQGLFEQPTTLPPRRAQDHRIPLLPGSQPVKSRPYRYTPEQKDEIERQVYDMLCSGIIQRSTSLLPHQSCWCVRRMVNGISV